MSMIPYKDLSIYITCLSVCLYPLKRQNGWTDRAQILRRTSHDPRVGLWRIKISKIRFQQNSIVIKFWEIHEIIFYKICELLFLFNNEYKGKMFTIEK